MRVLDPALQAALEAGDLVPRDFLWIKPRDRTSGAPVEFGAWSDLGAISAPVIDPVTGEKVTRVYRGIGAILQIDPIVLVTGLTVQTVTIRMNHIDGDVQQLVRGYDVRRAPVELHRGYLDPATMRIVDAAVPRFSGFIDDAPINTPAAGMEGSIDLVCASHTQDLTRSSSAKRSDADQRRRHGDDGFYRHAATVGNWQITWGQAEE